jgi:hypothetical protein
MKKTIKGLICKFNSNYRCDRCDSSLQFSMWNGCPLVLSISTKSTSGFVCVKCVLSKSKSNKNPTSSRNFRTPEELDEFVESQTVMVVHNVS